MNDDQRKCCSCRSGHDIYTSRCPSFMRAKCFKLGIDSFDLTYLFISEVLTVIVFHQVTSYKLGKHGRSLARGRWGYDFSTASTQLCVRQLRKANSSMSDAIGCFDPSMCSHSVSCQTARDHKVRTLSGENLKTSAHV